MKLSEYIKRFGDKQVDVEKLSEFIIEEDKVWLPEVGEDYYFVDVGGFIQLYENESVGVDMEIMEIAKVFKTKEEAEFERDKQKFLLFMEREFIRNSDVLDWENVHQNRYAIFYNHGMSKIIIDGYSFVQMQRLHTTNKEWLEQFIEEHEDDIKRYYFEIK